MLVQVGEGLVDGRFESVGRAEEVVVQRALFQVAPEALDDVEFGAVGRKPDDPHVVLVLGQEVQRRPRNMVGGVVEHQDQEAVPLRLQQLPQEGVEPGGVLAGIDQVMDLAADPVQGAVDAEASVGAGRGHLGPLAAEDPDLGQRGVQVNFTLVEEQEVKAVPRVEHVFLRNAIRAFFSS